MPRIHPNNVQTEHSRRKRFWGGGIFIVACVIAILLICLIKTKPSGLIRDITETLNTTLITETNVSNFTNITNSYGETTIAKTQMPTTLKTSGFPITSIYDSTQIPTPTVSGNVIEISAATQPSYWALDTSIHGERSHFGSALLTNGRVIISGGLVNSTAITSSSEIYSPSTGWQSVSKMIYSRVFFTLTPFANNTKALAAGNAYVPYQRTAEVFDSTKNIWTSTSTNMSSNRYDHTATLLGNGQILIAGGKNASGISISTAEIYIPSSNSFINTNNMILPRAHAVSTLLGDGSTVLITGGIDDNTHLTQTAELYINGSWIGTNNNMTESRAYHTAVLLNDGNILIAGGHNGGIIPYVNTEIYNATTRTFTAVGSMKHPRALFTLTLLQSGKVLATGGIDWTTNTYIQVCELYDPVTKSWSDTRQLNFGRYGHQTILFNNSVLVIGGFNGTSTTRLNSCEKYNL